MPILQDLGQLKKLYPDMWETFIGMAGAVIWFAPNDLTTAEYMSRRAGDTTRTAISQSNSENTSKSTTTSSGTSNSNSTGSNSGISLGQQFSMNESNSSGNSYGMSDGNSHGISNGTSTSTNQSTSSSSSNAPVKVSLMTPHDFFGLRTGFMMISADGVQHIIPAYAPAYYQIEQCMERARDNPYFTG